MRTLDLGRNPFLKVPTALGGATGCRHLTIMFVGRLSAALGGAPADSAQNPLLAMRSLRTLSFEQTAWQHEDVETLVALQQVRMEPATQHRSIKQTSRHAEGSCSTSLNLPLRRACTVHGPHVARIRQFHLKHRTWNISSA